MNAGQWFVIILSALMIAWYIIMSVQNRRRGIRAYRWLREGLETRGTIIQARWLGTSSTGAKLVWHPHAPRNVTNSENIQGIQGFIRELHVSFHLESREILPLWVFYHLQGQRDTLMIQALLSHAPKDEAICIKAGEKSLQQQVPAFKSKEIQWHEYRKNFYSSKPPRSEASADHPMATYIERWHNELHGIATQRKAPHVILKMSLPPLLNYAARDFWDHLFEFLEAF